MVCWTVPILLVLASYIFPLCSCAILPASSLLRPYPLNFNPSQPTTAPLVPTDNANIIYSTNPHIYYLQGPLCAVSFSTECDQREYAWKHISFHSEALNKLESYAAVTTKHNDDDENTPRRVEIDFPPSTNSIYIFAAPRSQVIAQPVAHQDICFSDISQVVCEDIDVSMAYTAALEDVTPVLLWAGKVPPRFPQGFRLTIRVDETAHASGQQSGLMSFYAAVFTESDTESLSSTPSPVREEDHTSYWPRGRRGVLEEGPAEAPATFIIRIVEENTIRADPNGIFVLLGYWLFGIAALITIVLLLPFFLIFVALVIHIMASIAFGVTGFLNLLLPWSMRAIMTVLGFDCSTTALPTTESSPPVPPNASATPAHSYGSIPQSHPPYSEQSDESSPTEA